MEKTISNCLEEYINNLEKDLSPLTVREYKYYASSFDSIKDLSISEIESKDIQILVRDWYLDFNLSAATIRRRISFLLSALKRSGCEKEFYIHYPATGRRIHKPRKIKDDWFLHKVHE